MKNFYRGLVASLCGAFLWAAIIYSPAAAAKTYRAQRFDVQVAVQPGGDLLVTETIDFRFDGGPFTFVFREIPFEKVDDVIFQDAGIDGRRLTQGSSAGQIEIETTNPLKVVWHFSPTTDANRVFTLNYRVRGAVRKGAADGILWRAIPEDHDYPIARSTVTFTVPQGIDPLEPPTLDRPFTSTLEGKAILLTVNDLNEDVGLVLSARFPLNAITEATPLWQVRETQIQSAVQSALPICVLLFFIACVQGFLGLGTYARRYQRDLSPPPLYTGATLPGDVPPALAGKLTGTGVSFVGAFLDLARRGCLNFIEGADQRGKRIYVLERKTNDEPLLPHETLLLDKIFPNGAREVSLTDTAGPLMGLVNDFDKALAAELVQHGWLDAQRQTQKSRLQVFFPLLFTLSLIISVVIPLVATNLLQDPAYIPPLLYVAGAFGGILLVSIAGMIYAGTFSALTPAGEDQAALWKGFRKHLDQVSRGKEVPLSGDYFERYFAYAAAFGLGSNWMKNIQKSGMLPSMAWLRGLNNNTGDFGAFYAATALWSSSSDGSSDGGGGGGASGGGSSGAG